MSVRNRLIPLWLVSITIASLVASVDGQTQEKNSWMKQARWGVMTHYLADWRARVDKEEMSVEKWNDMIDHFDVEGLAKQIASVGAGYYLITLGQNSGYYLAPNATYDRFVGIKPSKCSRRDLISDLYEALNKKGIKLMVYLPSGAPAGDSIAGKGLEWQNGPHPNREFQIKWEQVIKEWSERWGKKISGWWFDGCYWPNMMYRSPEPPNFASFAAAARAGNPQRHDRIQSGRCLPESLNNAIRRLYCRRDRSTGQNFDKARNRSTIDGAQIHILSFLGETWVWARRGLPLNRLSVGQTKSPTKGASSRGMCPSNEKG